MVQLRWSWIRLLVRGKMCRDFVLEVDGEFARRTFIASSESSYRAAFAVFFIFMIFLGIGNCGKTALKVRKFAAM